MRTDDSTDLTIIGPTGKVYALAGDDIPLSEQVRHNYSITGDYLRDVLETAIASASPEAAPLVFGQAVSKMLRMLPVPWLREFAYAGILRRAEQLSDEPVEALLSDSDPNSDSTTSTNAR